MKTTIAKTPMVTTLLDSPTCKSMAEALEANVSLVHSTPRNQVQRPHSASSILALFLDPTLNLQFKLETRMSSVTEKETEALMAIMVASTALIL